MTDQLVSDTTMSKEGRVVIPVSFRKAMGLAPGDLVHLVLEGKELRVTTPHALMLDLWAGNAGTGDGDAVADVRAFRASDTALSNARFEAQQDAPTDPRSEDEIADDVMSALGLGG